MDPFALSAALHRRRGLIAATVLLAVALGAVLGLALPPAYTARARVLPTTPDPSSPLLRDLGLSALVPATPRPGADPGTRVALATGAPTLDAVIAALQLRDAEGVLLRPAALLDPGPRGRWAGAPRLRVLREPGTELLLFEATASTPEAARVLADTAVRAAVSRAADLSRADTRAARAQLEAQLAVVEADLSRAGADLAAARREEGLVHLDAEVRAAVSRLSTLLLHYEENAAALQAARARLAEARAAQAQERPTAPAPASLHDDPRLAAAAARLDTLRAARARERAEKTERHPDILRLDAEIAAAEAALAEALAAFQPQASAVLTLEAEIAGLAQRGAELDAAIQRSGAAFSEVPDKLRRLGALELAASAAEGVYRGLQQQRFQVGVAEALLSHGLQVVEPAALPSAPAGPGLPRALALAFATGLAAALLLALLVDRLDDTLRTPADLPAVWPLPVLGLVPPGRDPSGRPFIDQLPPTHALSEAWRTARAGLQFVTLDAPAGLVGVLSALPGEGRTATAVNLAVAAAREGRRVLLIDADLRRPGLHRAFAAAASAPGLTDVLTGKARFEDAIQSTPVEGLFLLAAGPAAADPARLVESLRLRQLLLAAREQFDVVFLDTPPALVVPDALLLGRALDALVLVVAAGATPRRALASLHTRAATAGLRPAGAVLLHADYAAAGLGALARALARGAAPAALALALLPLGACGPAPQDLALALASDNPAARADAARAAATAAHDPQLVAALTDTLGAEPPALRAAAAAALAAQGDPAAVPALLVALQSDPEPLVQAAVVDALGRLRDPRAVPALQAHLAARLAEGALPADAVWALGFIGDPAALPTLVPLATHPDPAFAHVATQALRALGPVRAAPPGGPAGSSDAAGSSGDGGGEPPP